MGYTNFMCIDDELCGSYPVLNSRVLSDNGKRLLQESIADFENGDYSICETLDELSRTIFD